MKLHRYVNDQNNAFRARVLRLKQEQYVFHFANVQKLQCLEQKLHLYKIRPEVCQSGTIPASVCPGRQNVIHVIKWTRPSHLHFCILQAIKNWTVGRPGNKARLNIFSSL